MDPFRAHLITLLSIYQLPVSHPTPIPSYQGPTDHQTEVILTSLATLAHRMHSAEEALANLQIKSKLEKPSSSPRRTNMSISLQDLQSPFTVTVNSDPFNLSPHAYGNSMKAYHQAASTTITTAVTPTPETVTARPRSPLIIPPGPPAATASKSAMSPDEELKLLKAQVSDVARVCNAVARGDLGQKITVPVQGVVMVQLKDVVNTMVDNLAQFVKEIARVSQGVRSKNGQTVINLFQGSWQESIDTLNKLAAKSAG